MKSSHAAIILLLLLNTSLAAQEKNRVVFDTLKHQMIIEGYCDREFLEGFSPFNLYYSDEYRNYTPSVVPSAELDSLTADLGITIVMATWCGDSREQVPRFFKVMDEIGFPSEAIPVVGVNGSKTATGIDVAALRLDRVPTFIFSRNGMEIGRITETPVKTIEADLLEILKQKN